MIDIEKRTQTGALLIIVYLIAVEHYHNAFTGMAIIVFIVILPVVQMWAERAIMAAADRADLQKPT
jgi:hypothetical protein